MPGTWMAAGPHKSPSRLPTAASPNKLYQSFSKLHFSTGLVVALCQAAASGYGQGLSASQGCTRLWHSSPGVCAPSQGARVAGRTSFTLLDPITDCNVLVHSFSLAWPTLRLSAVCCLHPRRKGADSGLRSTRNSASLCPAEGIRNVTD